jgi:hypothetical protein
LLAKLARADGMILGPQKGAEMNNKRTYEKPELQKLGLLRDLTKFSFNGQRSY